MTIENCSVTGNLATENARLKETIAAQAAVIGKLREAIKAVEIDSEEVLDFDEFIAMMVPMDTYHALIEALPIPDDSAQVLKEWLDNVMGEPVAWWRKDKHGVTWYYSQDEDHHEGSIPLFRKPAL